MAARRLFERLWLAFAPCVPSGFLQLTVGRHFRAGLGAEVDDTSEREALRRVALSARSVCAYAMASVDPADIGAKAVIRDLYNALEELDHLDPGVAAGVVASLTK